MSLILALLAAAVQSSPTPEPKPLAAQAPVEHVAATIQFVRPQDVQAVPFEYSDNTVMIEAELAGQHGWMLIDTGAPHTTIDTGIAKELGLPIIPMKGDVVTSGGHRVPKLRVDDVALVIPHHFSVRMPMLAMDLGHLSRQTHRRIVGIVGNDIVSNMLLWVQKPQGQLILLPGANLNFTCKGPCTDRSFLQPIPVAKASDHEEVTASVNGRPLKLKIDTGAGLGISLTPAAWARVKPADAQVFMRHTIGGSGIEDQVQSSRLPELIVGAAKIEDVQVEVQPWEPSDGDGIIGMGVFSRYSFALDTKKGQLWLIPSPPDTSKLPPPVLSKPTTGASTSEHQ